MSIVVFMRGRLHKLPFGFEEDSPRCWIGGVVGGRHIRDHEKSEIVRGGVLDLVDSSRWRNHRAPGADRKPLLAIEVAARAFDHVVRFPLGRVMVQRPIPAAWGHAHHREVERMAPAPNADILRAAKRE